MSNFNDKLQTLLKTDSRFVDQEGDLLRNEVIDKAFKIDEKLIELLISDDEIKSKFFCEIKGHWVFNINTFVDFIQDKNFLNDSYTKYKNKIGLNIGGKFLSERKEISLVRPYKDCILEGGQNKEDQKRKELFFNEILAQDEIDRLLDPKVLTNWKKYNKDGKQKVDGFTRDEDRTIKDNLIIKGNNLLALHTLKKEFAGKVKLIYIDPPYNTGNDGFKYNDNFNHSTWLTFMKNRLEVARELLRDDGVIFVQCDDNEQAYLKVLMDETFKRECFISNFIWKKTNNPNVTKNNLGIETENILAFSKKESFQFYSKKLSNKDILEYKEKDKNGLYKLVGLNKTGTINDKRPNLEYIILAPDNTEILPKPRWRWSKEKFEWAKENDRIVFSKHNNGYTVYYKQYLNEDNNGNKINRGKLVSNLILDKGKTTEGTNEITAILYKGAFNFPKAEKLLKEIIYVSTKPGDIVLDYHLGSGTTCAVAHKMGRQYIGIEQMDYIETIAVERMKKVIEGEQGGISKTVERQGGGEFIYCELKKYNQTFIDQIETAKNTDELLNIWEGMKSKSFLNYNVDITKQEEAIEEFKQLSLDEQKQALVELLDKNQLYVNLSEVDDKNFEVSEEDKRLNDLFYGKKKGIILKKQLKG